MLKRILCLLWVMTLCGMGKAQTMQQFEYWIDDGYTERSIVQSGNTDVNVCVDIKEMTTGVHYFNFRAQNSEGIWGALTRYIFLVPDRKGENTTVSGFQYWIDDDFDGKSTVQSSSTDVPLAIDISNLEEGVHYFNFRALNSDGDWGALTRYIFLVTKPADPNLAMQDCEYWIDDDFDNRKNVQSVSTNISLALDVSTLAEGVHFLNFRARNTDGVWGALTRYIFMKSDELSTEQPFIIAYKYTIGKRSEYVEIAPKQELTFSEAIPIPAMTEIGTIDENCDFMFNGNTVKMDRFTETAFSIQFKDEAGKWSAPVCQNIALSGSVSHTAETLVLSGSVNYPKLGSGDFGAFKMSIAETGNYYLTSTLPCNIRIYTEDGVLYRSLFAKDFISSCYVSLAKGNYYGIVYAMEGNADETCTVSLTNNEISTDVVGLQCDDNAEITVTDISGIVVYNGKKSDMPKLNKGIYIFKTGKKAIKVCL